MPGYLPIPSLGAPAAARGRPGAGAPPDQVLPRLYPLPPPRRGRRLPLPLGADRPRPRPLRPRRDGSLRDAARGRLRLRLEGRGARLVAQGPRMELSPENKALFETIVRRYPVKRSALLPALRLVQEQEGWITRDATQAGA